MLDDYYGYLKEREMLLGERTGRVIRAGQAVRAKLIGVHLDRLEIDLELVAEAKKPGDPEAAGADLSRRERRAVEDSRRADRARQKRTGGGGRTGGKSGSGKAGGKPGEKSGSRRSGSGASSGKPVGKSGGASGGKRRGR